MNFLLTFYYLFFSLNKIQAVNKANLSLKYFPYHQIVNRIEKFDTEPVLSDLTGGHLEEKLGEAINDDEDRLIDLKGNQIDKSHEQEVSEITDRLSKLKLEKIVKGDAHVPSSLDNSLVEESDSEDFEHLLLPMSLSHDLEQSIKYFSLDKVLPGNIPPGIIVQNYSLSDKMKLIHLYQSNKTENRRELFHYIAQHIHNRFMNCAANFRKWISNPHSGEPIFYRNCVPCTNAVDLNLQSLFDHQINIDELKHYFVNTCDVGTKWISYISNMEYLYVDLKRHPTTTFTDVIRRNLMPNHRLLLMTEIYFLTVVLFDIILLDM